MTVPVRFLLLDDPSGTTIVTSAGTRPAEPGEAHHLAELGEALTRHTGLPSDVRREPPAQLDEVTALVVHVSQLDDLPATTIRAAVVDVPRADLASVLERPGVTAVVEHNQYWKWTSGGPADAAVCLRPELAGRLRRDALVTPLDGGRIARIRIDGPDLPGLLGDVLTSD